MALAAATLSLLALISCAVSQLKLSSVIGHMSIVAAGIRSLLESRVRLLYLGTGVAGVEVRDLGSLLGRVASLTTN